MFYIVYYNILYHQEKSTFDKEKILDYSIEIFFLSFFKLGAHTFALKYFRRPVASARSLGLKDCVLQLQKANLRTIITLLASSLCKQVITFRRLFLSSYSCYERNRCCAG